jgi:16S rRNA (cytidine1402-2'-O)-methyltransferase
MLYIVATPIGNLQDISARARDVLGSVDLVLCEDTRVTSKLLSAYEIKTSRESVHQHTTDAKLKKLINRMVSGENMAFVSDAGTPGVSDPGGKLVQLAVMAGVEVTALPGPSALATAMSLADFPVVPITFMGFPPHKKGRQSFFDEISNINHSIALYESKHRIVKTLGQLPADRHLFVGRELTKQFETHYRGITAEILTDLEKGSQKGEYVIVVAPKNWKS